MKRTKKGLFALLMVLVLAFSSMTVFADNSNTTLYVNGAYTGTESDGSADKPYTTIADAVAVATGNQTIKISAFDGEYDAFVFSNIQGLTFEGVAVNGEKPVIACGVAEVSWWLSGVVGAGNVSDTTFTGIEFKNYGSKQSWIDSCITSSQNSGADWDGLVISNCDFTLAEGASMGYAVAPCCGEFTMTGCTITGYDNGICLMDDSGALVDITITDNTIEVKNEALNGYWGAESPEDVTSTVTITGNDIIAVDGESTPVINIIDYSYQQGKDVDAIEVVVIENNTGDAEAVLTNMNEADVTVEDMEAVKSFSNADLAAGSTFVEEGEGFYIRYDANEDDNTIYELGEDGAVVEHEICTPELQNVVAATCTAAGYTGDEVCTVCGEVVKTGTVMEKIAHAYKDGKCTVCGAADPDYTTTSPKTGDASAAGLYVVAAFAAVAAIGGFRMRRTAR